MSLDGLSIGPPKRRPRRALYRTAALLVVVLALLLWLGVAPQPEVQLSADRPGIGRSTAITVDIQSGGRGLGPVDVELVQGDTVYQLTQEQFAPRSLWNPLGSSTKSAQLVTTAGSDHQSGLTSGAAELRVTVARPGWWLRQPAPHVHSEMFEIALEPPRIAVQVPVMTPRQGGTGVVRFTASSPRGSRGVRAGVRSGPHDFPASRIQSAAGTPESEFFALYAVGFNLEDAGQIVAWAEDDLGNRTETAFVPSVRRTPVKASTIRLSQEFMQRVVPPILAGTNEVVSTGALLDDYLLINGTLRRKNAEHLRKLGESSSTRFLSNGPFLQQPSTVVMDEFAARRSYVLDGAIVDTQVHLGYDLASVRQAEIVASNNGRVAWASDLGIYGKTVVLDHGHGLMTLYAHLSEIAVTVETLVEKGATLGRSGVTGLAGGDHLHFSTLLRGTEVDAREWWDPRWVATHIAPLSAAQ